MKFTRKLIPTLFALSAILLSVFITSCASTNQVPKLNKVFVTNTTRVDLLPVSAIKTPVDEYQYFEGDFGKSSFKSTLYLQADQNGISIILLNDFGIEMGSIIYDGISAEMESSLFPDSFKCEYILLDLQNAYADSEALKSHYSNYGLTFAENTETVTNEAGEAITKTRRTVSKKNKLIEEVNIILGNITITNHLRGYEYQLTSSE